MGSLHQAESESHHPVLNLIISLMLRYMRPIEGSSTTCADVPDLLKNFLSARLQTMLKDPKIQQLTSPVTIRREKKVVLELSLHSDSHPIEYWDWKGIQLPRTSSVKSGQHSVPGKLLKLSIQVSGCSTAVPNIQPCWICWNRERQAIDPNIFPSNLQPYMIDFKAENLTTLLSGPLDGNCLKADVTFHFTCYSKHHGGPYR